MKFKIHIDDKYFNLIVARRKTLECRLNKIMRTFIAVGDNIIFVNKDTNNTCECEVTAINRYRTIEEMVDKVNLSSLGFEDCDKKDVVKTYQTFYPNSQDIHRLGMVVFTIKRV
ncbi:MAG: ASCH domain-containing protein [Bacilli bacterium]|nr:ASCH domain-containing protein [Bacilli bacterium]